MDKITLCINCGCFRVNDGEWGDGYLLSISTKSEKGVCPKCALDVAGMLEPYKEQIKAERLNKEQIKVERLKEFITGLGLGDPEYVGKFQTREETKLKVQPREVVRGQIGEGLYIGEASTEEQKEEKLGTCANCCYWMREGRGVSEVAYCGLANCPTSSGNSCRLWRSGQSEDEPKEGGSEKDGRVDEEEREEEPILRKLW